MDSVNKTHVLMFPWLAHGHISPFLELAKKLASRNFIIHLCSSLVNIHSFKGKISESFSESIKLVELELPSYSDLPSQYHSTNGLSPQLMPRLKEAFDNAETNFCKLLDSLKPDLLIYDFLQPWAPIAAGKRGIPAVELISSSATMNSKMVHDCIQPPGTEFPFISSIYYRDYEQEKIKRDLEKVADPQKDLMRVFDCFDFSSNIVLIKSFKEIEGRYIDYMSHLSGKKVLPLGPLVQDPGKNNDQSEIIEWLDKKGQGSTVFVSFGSEFFLSQEDLEEIAHGLESSGVNFIWVLRFPKGEKVNVHGVLPRGFLERVGDRGLIVEGWAPQNRILDHPSTGGFVSHCGWNSVIESMKFGVPIISMPMHIDQPINARLVDEVGVGMEAVRDKQGKLRRETVASVIKQVLEEKSGEAVRSKARKMKEDMALKGDEEIDIVVKELLQLVNKEKKP